MVWEESTVKPLAAQETLRHVYVDQIITTGQTLTQSQSTLYTQQMNNTKKKNIFKKKRKNRTPFNKKKNYRIKIINTISINVHKHAVCIGLFIYTQYQYRGFPDK